MLHHICLFKFGFRGVCNKMALRTGGLSGIEKLINSAALGTIELSTGLQIRVFSPM
jgi:hypothetical protein